MKVKYGSVCSGVEAATLAWAPLGWECQFVAEVEPFPCAVLQQRLGASRPLHPLDPKEASTEKDRKEREKWIKQLESLNKEGTLVNEGDFTKIGDKYRGQIDLLCGGTPCFVAGTQVLTPNGYVPIETLEVGDEVISGLGETRSVIATGSKIADVGDLFVHGHKPIRCTPDHKFYCAADTSDILSDDSFIPVPASASTGCFAGAMPRHLYREYGDDILSTQAHDIDKNVRLHKNRNAYLVEGFEPIGRDIVYNITVEVDHNYIVEGLWVKNCQDLSMAGKRAGLEGERSALAIDFVQLAYQSESPVVLWENVPGALSSNKGRDFATLLSLFTGKDVEVPDKGWGNAGFIPNDDPGRYGVSWRILDMQFTRTPGFPLGIPQRRRRLFVVGCLGDWAGSARILLEPDRNNWDTPTRIKARKSFTGFTCNDFRKTGGTLRPADGLGEVSVGEKSVRSVGNGQTDSLVNEPEIAQTLNCMHDQQAVMITESSEILCRAGDSMNAEYGYDLSPTLKANADRNTPILCVNDQGGSFVNVDEELLCTLRANPHGNDPIVTGEVDLLAYENHPADSRVTDMGDTCQTLSSRMGTGGGNVPYVQHLYGFEEPTEDTPATAIAENIIGRQAHTGGNGPGYSEEVSYTLNCAGVMGVVFSYVRRLLPVEAEVLMGFPKLWTRISWLGKPESECPKAPRYKCCGNSMGVNVMEWLGIKINEYLEEKYNEVPKVQ